MHLNFTHAGQDYHLVKHPTVVTALKSGAITDAEARTRPWYLRRKLPACPKTRAFRLVPNDKQSIALARDIINGSQSRPDDFRQWLAHQDAQRDITLGALAADWFALGCPFDGEAARSAAAAEQVKSTCQRALKFWQQRRVNAVTHKTMSEFAAARRQNIQQGGDGSRSVDIELASLSSLCEWAVLTERIEKNPFAKRKRFQGRESVRHCHEAMPDDDEQLHRILREFFTSTNHETVIAGAVLAFTALTGLRPGEPFALTEAPTLLDYAGKVSSLAPGTIYMLPDGQRRMRVERLKRGQNPSVIVTPVVEQLLHAYGFWKNQTDFAADIRLFPTTQEAVAARLKRACAKLGLPRMKMHGFGRAYYVRVRRGQGMDDATIAVELGQSSNGDLIRSVYGDPGDTVGGNQFDWIPKDTAPAWTVLTASQPAAENILRIA